MSVRLTYSGRLGNHLLINWFGKIIAKKKSYYLYNSRIEGFLDTYSDIEGEKKELPLYQTSQYDCWNVLSKNLLGDVNGQINVNTFLAEYKELIPYKEYIRTSVVIENEEQRTKPSKNDLVVHIRLGDYVGLNSSLSFETYYNIIKQETFDKCFLVTDDTSHNIVKRLVAEGCIIYHSSVIDDFVFLKNANKIVISLSTFSWCAAFLSNAEKIYFPISENKWPFLKNPAKNEIDFRVFDEPRWVYV